MMTAMSDPYGCDIFQLRAEIDDLRLQVWHGPEKEGDNMGVMESPGDIGETKARAMVKRAEELEEMAAAADLTVEDARESFLWAQAAERDSAFDERRPETVTDAMRQAEEEEEEAGRRAEDLREQATNLRARAAENGETERNER